MRRFLTLVLLCLCAALPALAESALRVRHDGAITGYDRNTITVSAPAAGTLSVTVSDMYSDFRTLTAEVPAGESTLPWNGLREDGQRIGTYNDTYVLSALLECADGAVYTDNSKVEVRRSRQALLFCLPSSDTLYLGGGEDWFVEVCLVRAGTVILEIADARQPEVILQTRSHPLSVNTPKKYKWDGCIQGKPVAPGNYLLRYYAQDNPDYDFVIPLAVSAEAAPVLPVTVTGPVMPETGASDEEIWALMLKPSVVVDIKNTNHQKVFAAMDTRSAALGTLHGQSQGVQVLAIVGDWAQVTAYCHEDGSPVTGYVPLKNLKTVMPNGPWGLLVDKNTQTLTLFHQGERVTTLPVSTGLAAKDRLIRETAAGTFLTDEHMGVFQENSYYYEFPVRYDGGNLLHQLGYLAKNRHADYTAQRATLGQKASHACVRLPDHPLDESGVDAYWLWTHLPWHTRIIILDDPETREAQRAAITGEVRAPAASAVPLPTLAPPEWQPEPAAALAPGQTELRLTLGGDAVLGTRESWWKREDALPAYLEQHGYAWPFSGLQAIFAADDMTFVNLECVLKANKAGERTDRPYRFRGLPAWAAILTEGSVEQVNIANNHYIDYQAAGKQSTREALTAAGVPFSGYSYTYVWERDGHKIGFAGVRETIYLQQKGRIADEIASLRAAGCEVVIYSCHWGTEYASAHNDLQLEMAQAAADAGADLVVGTHPHVVQGVSLIGHTPVLWSLGNLMFGGTIEMTTFDAMLASVGLRFDETGYLGCSLRLVPVLTSGRAAEGINDYRPVPAQGEDAARILRAVQADSAFDVSGEMWFGR